MNALETERLLITGSLLFGAYTTWFCPCGNKETGEGLLSCHYTEFFLATAAPLALVIFINRNNTKQR
jgi:hypothetical protein